MENRVITKTGATGTQYDYHFELDHEQDKLHLICVKVQGEEITEVMDADLLQGVYNECYQQWIMHAA